MQQVISVSLWHRLVSTSLDLNSKDQTCLWGRDLLSSIRLLRRLLSLLLQNVQGQSSGCPGLGLWVERGAYVQSWGLVFSVLALFPPLLDSAPSQCWNLKNLVYPCYSQLLSQFCFLNSVPQTQHFSVGPQEVIPRGTKSENQICGGHDARIGAKYRMGERAQSREEGLETAFSLPSLR